MTRWRTWFAVSDGAIEAGPMRGPSRWVTVVAAAAVVGVVAVAVMTLMPLERWQSTFWPRWLNSLGLTALFGLACASVGLRVVEWLTPTSPRDGAAAVGVSAGVLLFGLSMATAGLFHLLTPFFFWALPLALILVGLGPLVRAVRSGLDRVSRAKVQLSPVEVLVLILGVVAVIVLVPQALNPDNINFDARWYHLRASQRYAMAGGLVRSPEGDYLLSLPQLASWINTWALMAPLAGLTDKLQLALHLELFTVLVGAATIPPLTRAIWPHLPRGSARLAWVAFFFFPSIYIYDNGLFGGADHVAALWAAPMVLTWLQARSRADARSWVLWGLVTTGALAKYTSLMLVLPLTLVAAVDWLWQFRSSSRVGRLGPLLAAGTTVLLAMPYWVRNWVWYHDPVYPLAARVFQPTPWAPDSEFLFGRISVPTNFAVGGLPLWGREGTLAGTLEALSDYWREVYTWADFTGQQPAFGFVFLVSLAALPFLRHARIGWLVAVLAHLGIAAWFNIKHEMRYLSILTPVMAAMVAGVAAALWTSRRLELRVAVTVTVVAQLMVFGDLPFRRSHRMNGQRSPVEAGLEVLSHPRGSSGPADGWAEMNRALPPTAVPVIHGVDLALGLERQSLTDVSGLQFGLNYGRLGSVAAVYRQLRELGATHVIWTFAGEQLDSLAGEALFRALTQTLTGHRIIGHRAMGELPATPPEDSGSGMLYVGCEGLFPTGLYTVSDLALPLPNWPLAFPSATPRKTAGDWHTLLPHATYVVLEERCGELPLPPEFRPTGVQRAPSRGWRHFLRVQGNELPW